MNRDARRIIIGLFVIAVGAVALLDNLFQINDQHVLHFWPVMFMLVGVVHMTRQRHGMSFFWGGVLFALGALLTLSNAGLIVFHLRDWWPVFIIAAGVALILRDRMKAQFRADWEERWRSHFQTPSLGGKQNVNAFAMMSGNRMTVTATDFEQGEATSIMGAVVLDFRSSQMLQSQAVLRVSVFWGGVTLYIPPDWQVEFRAVAIMGGVDDKTLPPAQPSKTLVIDGFVMMGGLVVKN